MDFEKLRHGAFFKTTSILDPVVDKRCSEKRFRGRSFMTIIDDEVLVGSQGRDEVGEEWREAWCMLPT